MDKKSLRKLMIQKRLDLADDIYLAKSNFIYQKLINDLDFKNAKTIGIYVSYQHEVDTLNLINHFINQKTICVPKIKGKNMDFYQIDSLTQLKPNRLGILEPENTRLINRDAIDLMIVPIVAYDQNNNRLGYGGGFYDRYLKDYHGQLIGLAFSFQKVALLPVEPFDLPISKIISEK